MVLKIHAYSFKGLSVFTYKGWYCVFFVFAISVVFSGCVPEQKQTPQSSQEHNHTEKTSTAQNNSDTNSITPVEGTAKQELIIRLVEPTSANASKAYTGTPTAFTYDEILALVAPGNTAALSIDSITRVTGQLNILTPNPEEKTLTFADIGLLTARGQQGMYTVTFSSSTHKVVPSSMNIPFVVKKGYMNLDDIELVQELPKDFNHIAMLWNKAQVTRSVRSVLPSKFSNFSAPLGAYSQLFLTDFRRAPDFFIMFSATDEKSPFGKAPIRFSFDAPGIIKGYVTVILM